jgi:flavin reductase (DIM6/NTAB) family NADH-FMN oxidoreductase RutF
VTAERPETVPSGVRRLLDGTGLAEKVGTTLLLVTVGDDDWPHIAMLSPGEVLVTEDDGLALALHASSGTCRNLRRDGRALVSVVAEGVAYRIRIRAQHVPEPPLPGADALFTAGVERIDEDRVGYARVLHGTTYELVDEERTVERWTAKLDRLRALA